jgi:uncharacterized tellurite resistance protein B-like protein
MPADAINSAATKRARRIERRCIAPVVAALHAGEISPRSADVFLRLTPEKQRVELERRLAEIAERERKHQTVTKVIREYLDGLGVRKVDLIELGKIIRETLAFAKPN